MRIKSAARTTETQVQQTRGPAGGEGREMKSKRGPKKGREGGRTLQAADRAVDGRWDFEGV